MSWFQDAFLWPQLLTSGKGRDQLKNDIKYGEGTAAVGNPLHGLTAGYKLHELMSPTVHINDRIQDIRKNGFGSDHLKWAIDDQNHNLQDAFKENLPALLAWGGGSALGVGSGGGGGSAAGAGSAAGGGAAAEGAGLLSAGDAAALSAAEASAAGAGTSGVSASSGMGMSAPSSGFNWGALQSGLGLLGQMGGGQQQQPVAASPPPDQSVTQESTRRRMQVAVRLQELRAKPNKTAAERAEMKELSKNPMGLL